MSHHIQTTENHMQNIALQLLSHYRQCDFDFVTSLELVFSEIPALNKGQIMLIEDGVAMDGIHTVLLAEYLSRVFGVRSKVTNTPWEHCKAQLQSKKQPDGRWIPVSPWFIQWYSILDIVEPTIQGLVRRLHRCEVSNDGVLLYRGESKEYPSVCSTLSRHWTTTNPAALKMIREGDEQDIRSQGFTGDEGDIQGVCSI